MPLGCVDCGHGELDDLGPGMSFGQYAGGALVTQPYGSLRIWRCQRCELTFKSPVLDVNSATELYNQTDGSVWSATMPRPEFDLAIARIARAVESESQNDVLDVGCNRGEFLARLPLCVNRFGVEVNRNAAAVARASGIRTWHSLAELPEEQRFDFITCFDVIEHVQQPAAFVGQLLNRLKSAGELIVSSGNATVFGRQWRPALNWYYANPEHISFVSRSWFEHMLAGSGAFRLEEVHEFTHGHRRAGIVPRLKVALFKAFPRGYLGGYRCAKRLMGSHSGLFVPGNGSAADHACFVVSAKLSLGEMQRVKV